MTDLSQISSTPTALSSDIVQLLKRSPANGVDTNLHRTEEPFSQQNLETLETPEPLEAQERTERFNRWERKLDMKSITHFKRPSAFAGTNNRKTVFFMFGGPHGFEQVRMDDTKRSCLPLQVYSCMGIEAKKFEWELLHQKKPVMLLNLTPVFDLRAEVQVICNHWKELK